MIRYRGIKIRKRWRRNPRTRIKESGKIYKRPKMRRNTKRTIKYESR